MAACPTKKQSKFSFPISATNSLGCSGALTPFSHKGLFHRSGSGSSLSIQHFRKGHQVSLLPPHSPFLFSMILPWGSSLGLLPFCLVHNQQKGRYIAISHQGYDSPWWSDFICRASLQWSNFSALKENLACTIQLGGIPNTKICIRWGQTISYYTVKAVPRPWIYYKCTAYFLSCERWIIVITAENHIKPWGSLCRQQRKVAELHFGIFTCAQKLQLEWWDLEIYNS